MLRIMEALANSRVMVLVWSSLSDKSIQVKREVSNALDYVGIPLIPFRIEEIDPSNLRYYLGNIQWLDASQPPLEDDLQRLVIQVKDAIRRASEQAASAKPHSQEGSPANRANEEDLVQQTFLKTSSAAVQATTHQEPSLPQRKTIALEKWTPAKGSAPKQPAADAKQEGSKRPANALGVSQKAEKADREKAPEKGDTSAQLLVEIEKVLDDCTDSHLYFGRAIPPAKLANALSKYPPDSSPKDVLVFFDNTVFGGGKSSLILTPDAVYWFNNISGANGRIGYVDIETVRFMASHGFFDSNKILINQEEIEFYAGSSQVAAALANVIRHLVAQRKSAS